MGGTGDTTVTTDNTDSGISSGVATNAANLSDRLKAAINDGSTVELPGLSFDSAGNIATEDKTSLTMLKNVIGASPSLKGTVTVYGTTEEEAAKKANAIKADLVAQGVEPERIKFDPKVGESASKVSFQTVN